jgi:hypothetical protein
MATAAQGCAFWEFQLPAITRLEEFEIRFIVAVVAKVVAVVASMTHYDVRVFFGNDQIVLLIKPQRRRFIPFMARITIEVGKVGFTCRELAVGNSGGRVAGN